MKNKIIFCLLILCGFFKSFGSDFITVKQEIKQWEVIDIKFQTKSIPVNPFEIEFYATFEAPDKTTRKILGFYNGATEYVIRFSAKQIGAWQFKTFSSVKELQNNKHKISVIKNELKHGGIVTKPENPQHFYYEDGTPYFAMAFECDWLFALDYHNKENTPKTNELVENLTKNKINQIVTTVYSFDVDWEKDEKLVAHPEYEYGGDLKIFPFSGSNEKPDYSSLNIDFFKKFDRIVSAMDANNIVAHLMIYVWNKQVNWPDTQSEADNRYFDYIIKRYQAYPNIIWDISKEALNNPRCTEAYGIERIQRIKKLDAYQRLITVHDYGFCSRNSEFVDFISVQNWGSSLYNQMLAIKQKYPKKPIFNIEHGGYEVAPYSVFEGDYTASEVCLRRNYMCVFAGTYSTYYWQGAAWNVIIHKLTETNKNSAKLKHYKNLVTFFEKYPLSKFSPSPENNHSGFTLKNDSGTYLVYIPKENKKFSVYWKAPMAIKSGTYQWFNTLNGEFSEINNFEKGQFTSPWQGKADSILIRQL